MMNTKQTTIKHSPWGPVQHETILAPGLTAVSTASHGGIHLSPEHAFIFKASFPGFKSFAGLPWLEEDCDACAAVIRWPECFSGEAVHAAVAFYMRNINGTNTIPCQKFLNQTPAGEVAKAVALKWEDDHRGQWQTGGGSTHKDGWLSFLYEIGGKAAITRVFPRYPDKSIYTTAELAGLTKPDPATPKGWEQITPAGVEVAAHVLTGGAL